MKELIIAQNRKYRFATMMLPVTEINNSLCASIIFALKSIQTTLQLCFLPLGAFFCLTHMHPIAHPAEHIFWKHSNVLPGPAKLLMMGKKRHLFVPSFCGVASCWCIMCICMPSQIPLCTSTYSAKTGRIAGYLKFPASQLFHMHWQVQLYEHFIGRQFHGVPQALTSLQVKQFTLVPAAFFLCVLDNVLCNIMETENLQISAPNAARFDKFTRQTQNIMSAVKKYQQQASERQGTRTWGGRYRLEGGFLIILSCTPVCSVNGARSGKIHQENSRHAWDTLAYLTTS